MSEDKQVTAALLTWFTRFNEYMNQRSTTKSGRAWMESDWPMLLKIYDDSEIVRKGMENGDIQGIDVFVQIDEHGVACGSTVYVMGQECPHELTVITGE
jgi:hypothetical protein